MPTYEYKCNSCGYSFDVFQWMSEKPLKICLKCSKKVTRVIGSGGGILFKGIGFYETDYKKDPAPPPKKDKQDG